MATKKTRTPEYKLAIKNFFIGLKDRLPNSSSLLNFLSVLISAGALWYSAKSASAAIDAVQLQRQQSIEESRQDSINDFRDSAKYVESVKLTHEQIEALRQQVKAMRDNIEQENAYQRPLLDIEEYGYHLVNNSENLKLSYWVRNSGIRPAELKNIKFFYFDSGFNFINSDTSKHSNTLFGKREEGYYVPMLISGQSSMTLSEVMAEKKTYSCFIIEFMDLIDNKPILRKTKPRFFRWEDNKDKNPIAGRFDMYYAHNECTEYQSQVLTKKLNELTNKKTRKK